MRQISSWKAPFRKPLLGALAPSLILVAASSSAWANNVTGMAQRLAKLRGEVESLAADLNAKSASTNDQLRSLARQKADIELELKREQTRFQKLSSAIAKRREEIRLEKEKGDKLVPLFTESAETVRAYVRQSLPFRTKERLDAIAKIEEQHKAGLLSPARAIGRLWSFVEDEFRMTRENGLFQQTVSVAGKEQLAEVIRVGMVMLLFKSADDSTVGKATKQGDGWTFVTIDGSEERKQVLELFKSFKKQIRVGYFEIPNAIPGEMGLQQ